MRPNPIFWGASIVKRDVRSIKQPGLYLYSHQQHCDWMNGLIDDVAQEWLLEIGGWMMDGWMIDGWMDGWMIDGWMDGWMDDRWMDGWMDG